MEANEEHCHFCRPVPHTDGKRHAFKGARRWVGQSSGDTVCGITVAMARPSDMDWIYLRTCSTCRELLINEQRT